MARDAAFSHGLGRLLAAEDRPAPAGLPRVADLGRAFGKPLRQRNFRRKRLPEAKVSQTVRQMRSIAVAVEAGFE
jgi:hypothetical protein